MTKTKSISLGCRLNAYEAARMETLAAEAGQAATVIVNTCAVTNEAVRQSRQAVRRARTDNPDAEIVVTGCAAELDPAAFRAMPEVGRVLGNAEKLSEAAWQQDADVPEPDVFRATTLPRAPAPLKAPMIRAPLEVQNGCDHRCTFCIIPFGRGRARSKRPADAVHEAQQLVDRGAREIVLTGVDLTSYGPDLGEGVTLADMVEALLEGLPDRIRLRLSSIDGAEVDDRLFSLITNEPRIAPYLHLSLQSGDDMILKRMKRRHTRGEAVDLTRRLKSARPEIAFGADLIAGFPTETEEMFENSARLIEDAALVYVHVFPFSPRDGTPAARMPQVDRPQIKARASRLRALADHALFAHLESKVGTTDQLLVEHVKDGLAIGKTPDFVDVHATLSARPGEIVDVAISARQDRLVLGTQVGKHQNG